MPADIEGLLNAYRLATAPQDGTFSPIEAERQEQRAVQAAREIADLLLTSAWFPELAGVR